MQQDRLDQVGRLFAIGGLGLLFNFLMHAYTTPTYPLAVGMPGVFWLPAFAVSSLLTVWSGVMGACLLLMRPDRQRQQLARTCLIIHGFLLVVFVFGLMSSLEWKARFASPLPLTEDKLLAYDLATFLTAMVFALAVYASYQGSMVFWRIAGTEVSAT